MKKTILVTENQLESIVKLIKEEKQLSDVKIKEGAFGDWCVRNGHSKGEDRVTCECIEKGLASKNDTTKKRANYALTWHHKKGQCKSIKRDKKKKD